MGVRIHDYDITRNYRTKLSKKRRPKCHFQDKNISKYQEWMNFATLEAAGNKELQTRLAEDMQSNSVFDIQRILKTKADAVDAEPEHTEDNQK